MLRLITHNWSLKLLALCLALGMWIFVVGQERAELSLKIPVEYTQISDDVVVVGETVGELDVRVSGPRSLVRRAAAQGMGKVLDLSGLKEGKYEFQVIAEDLDLPPGVQVSRISPAQISVNLAKRITRQVPVRPVLKGKPAPGFEVAEITFKPDKVDISGPEEGLAALDWIWTVPIEVSGLNETQSKDIGVRLPQGMAGQVNPPAVRVTVKVVSTQKPEAKAPAPEAALETAPESAPESGNQE